ncbi:cytochrome-ba3 oxidase subunit [Natrinema halophilum]|uniref:Cytochrome-ba3 oxidase subunit n=1 Tax=Natrinema halophilum TaxID=1699371 RepID=A0A7D5HAW2_9EURY|nr:cytochrome-ba3 oxidase subunit [Natrinema halophilum]QLG50975.1 cytochrome-ba3 oxidase subunit [Natrinema halophilum]
MNLETVGPRFAAGAGLLAILPVLVYGLTNSVVAGVVSAVNVAIIIGSLYIAMAPIDESHDDHHGNGTAS